MKRFMTLAAATVLTAGTLTGCGAAGSSKGYRKRRSADAALSDAEVIEADVTRLKVGEDRDDGRKVYEIRFDVNGMEYDYEVAASDGQILSAESEELAPEVKEILLVPMLAEIQNRQKIPLREMEMLYLIQIIQM